MKKNNFATIETILSVAKKGGMFILVDDEKRENEGDLVISSSDSTAKYFIFMAKHGRGLICLAMDSLQAKKLNLSLMSPVNQSRNKTAFTISFLLTFFFAAILIVLALSLADIPVVIPFFASIEIVKAVLFLD